MRPKLELPKTFNFTTELTVRVTDINYGGHLGNDKVLSYIHEARVRFLRQFGYTELDVDGLGTIMVDAIVIYKGEAFLGETLEIGVGAGDFHKLGCDFFYKLINKETGKEIARAKTGLVFFDYEQRKMRPMPDKFRARCGA